MGWFADVVRRSGEATISLVETVAAIQSGWRRRVAGLRADATAVAALDVLPEHPVVSAALVSERLGVSDRAARSALDVLHKRGVVEPFPLAPSGPGRPRLLWLARELVEAVTSWSAGP